MAVLTTTKGTTGWVVTGAVAEIRETVTERDRWGSGESVYAARFEAVVSVMYGEPCGRLYYRRTQNGVVVRSGSVGLDQPEVARMVSDPAVLAAIKAAAWLKFRTQGTGEHKPLR